MVLLPSDPLNSGVLYDTVQLQIGSNPDIYTLLEDVNFHFERPKYSRYATGTTASPPILRITFIGVADNYIEATLVMSVNEFATWGTTYFNLDSHRNVPIEFFRITMADDSGVTKTIGNTGNTPPGFKGRLMVLEGIKPLLGYVKYRVRIELLEDTLTIS